MSFLTFGIHIPESDSPDRLFECLVELQDLKHFDDMKEKTDELFVFCNESTLQLFAFTLDEGDIEKKTWQIVKKHFALSNGEMAKYQFHLDGVDAIKSFLNLAIGINHLQETNISIEQFRDSFEKARSRGFIGPKLNKLYQRGLWLAEKIRLEANLQKRAISPEAVVVELAEKIFGDLKDHKALVAVNRFSCRKFVHKLFEHHIGELVFWEESGTKSFISTDFNCRVIQENDFPKILPTIDLLFVFNQRLDGFLKESDFTRVMNQRKNATLLYVPYFDAAGGSKKSSQLSNIYNLYTYTKEDLQKIVYANFKKHQQIIYVIEQLVDQEIEDFVQWLNADEHYRFGNIIGKSETMQKIMELIARIAQTDITVLIDGESGTGKELIAKSIHEHSARKDKPFVVVNCGAIPENLMESELFGYVRGAFTGATGNKTGLFETANRGTIFLDEIGDLPLSMQVKLLRFLQEGEIKPVGSTKTLHLDVRLLAATNRNLEEMIEYETFRQDLYYRLNVIQMTLPPLKDRLEDILPLAEFFVKKYADRFQKNVYAIREDARQSLQNYIWKGNVRELENVVERAVALATGYKITNSDLPPALLNGTVKERNPEFEYSGTLKELEKHHIANMLNQYEWNYDLAAKMLGIGRTTLWRKMKEYGISNKKNERA